MRKFNDSDFVPAERHTTLTTGRVIQMLRELKEWTQNDLTELRHFGDQHQPSGKRPG